MMSTLKVGAPTTPRTAPECGNWDGAVIGRRRLLSNRENQDAFSRGFTLTGRGCDIYKLTMISKDKFSDLPS